MVESIAILGRANRVQVDSSTLIPQNLKWSCKWFFWILTSSHVACGVMGRVFSMYDQCCQLHVRFQSSFPPKTDKLRNLYKIVPPNHHWTIQTIGRYNQGCVPISWFNFLSIPCSFWEKMAKVIGWRPTFEIGAHLKPCLGNPGSTTANENQYDKLHVGSSLFCKKRWKNERRQMP